MADSMSAKRYNLAIETSGRVGGVCLGAGDAVLGSERLPAQQRHAIQLMPAIDRLVRTNGFEPAACEAVCVSVGPGSFTGLRIGVTAAKALARVSGATIAAVPTLDAIVENVPADRRRVAVCLNAKRGQCFTGIYERGDETWRRVTEPNLLTVEQVMAHEPVAVVGDEHVIERLDWPGSIERLDPRMSEPRSEVVWRLGRAMVSAGEVTDAYALAPMYVRLPEAEEVWQNKETAARQASR